MIARHKQKLAFAALMATIVFVPQHIHEPKLPQKEIIVPTPEPRPQPYAVPEPQPQQQLWTDSERYAMAKTLAGECYDDKPHDKRLVCEVILNRVSDERFEDTIIDVLETPHAFQGYWAQSRQITEDDLQIAEQAIADWYANDCEPLSDIRFFSAGDGRENQFY